MWRIQQRGRGAVRRGVARKGCRGAPLAEETADELGLTIARPVGRAPESAARASMGGSPLGSGLDLALAFSLSLALLRVPAYSAFGSGEHAVALATSVNRSIPQAGRGSLHPSAKVQTIGDNWGPLPPAELKTRGRRGHPALELRPERPPRL